jgi:hypothetical protein
LKPLPVSFSAFDRLKAHDGLARVVSAGILTACGSGLFWLVRLSLHGVIDSEWSLVGCVIGAFASSVIALKRPALMWSDCFKIAMQIVSWTYLAIAISSILGSNLSLVPPDYSFLDILTNMANCCFWEIVATAWWLIPGTALAVHLLRMPGAVRPSSES